MSEWGYSIKYTGNRCPNCGRVRLELYENGKEVCEKCEWCPQEGRYVECDEIFPPEEDWHG